MIEMLLAAHRRECFSSALRLFRLHVAPAAARLIAESHLTSVFSG